MPELPEIAILRKYVNSTSLQKKIVGLEFLQTSLLQAPKIEFDELKEKSFGETKQLGKYLFLKAEEGLWLGFHFGMTGKLEYYQYQDPPKYTHLIITFDDGSHLAYVCRRKLGKIYLTSGVEEFQKSHSIGKDALVVDFKMFKEILKDKKGMIKTVLTDQHAISGIGNVYADEILYQSRVHPKTGADKLTVEEVRDIFSNMEKILKTAIKNEGPRSALPPHYLIPHRKKDGECPDCKGKVEKISVSGRSTYFCPSCQIER